jgi:hypothetical protein
MVVQAGGIWLAVQAPVYTALISGVIADLLRMRAAIQVVAALTLLSGLHVAFRMRETHGVAKREPQSIPSPVAHP